MTISVFAVLLLSAATLQVVSVEPAAHSIGASVDTPIVVHFDRPVSPPSITDGMRAFGRWSGAVAGSYAFANGDRTVTLTPDTPFSAGETVTVFLSRDVEAADGTPMRNGGFTFQFWTRAQPAAVDYAEIDRMSTRVVPSEPSQAYGGIASDLDGDGYLDITIVNEITADLRVFPSKADGTGLFHPFVVPTFPVGDRASPSEPADFNRDGVVDICVANIDDASVSVLLGLGDGTFAPQQEIPVGLAPRGIAVLDADGDGDVDIVNTNSGSQPLNMSLLANDGTGVFGPPTYFAAGAAGAWALASADMDDDGILDLVIGANAAERIIVHRGNGDGTFVPVASQPAAGRVWMLVVGDVDGDGDEDVASVNGTDDNAAILLGDGAGGLAPPQVYATDPFVLATDLGDLDGDGDLDWITSSFFGDWRLHLNDGAGAFTFLEAFPATSAASCSLMLDFDNDGDLDLALIDEIADEVVLMRNGGFDVPGPPPAVPDGDGKTTSLTVGKSDPDGTILSVWWDTATCPATDHHLVFGAGSALPNAPGGLYGPVGGRCGVGNAQPFGWLTSPDPELDPLGLVWFLVVADDAAGVEGSWGLDGAGNERNGPGANGASAVCDIVDKNAVQDCPGARR